MCLCHQIKNGWVQEITGHLCFVRKTTDFVQTTTSNWLTTRDIWWSVSTVLAFWPNMNEPCLSWRNFADMSPKLSTRSDFFSINWLGCRPRHIRYFMDSLNWIMLAYTPLTVGRWCWWRSTFPMHFRNWFYLGVLFTGRNQCQ